MPPWKRNTDEGWRRRERARGAAPDPNQAVADKLRVGRGDMITLGELAGVTDLGLVQAIPSPIWQAMLNKVGGAERREEIPVRLGPVSANVGLFTRGEYPSVTLSAPLYGQGMSDAVVVFESSEDREGRLRVMVYGDPYDPEGAPTHYINLSPYDPARDDDLL